MKKPGKVGSGRTMTTPEAATRVQRRVAQINQGIVPKKSVAARMAAAAVQNFGKSGGKKPVGRKADNMSRKDDQDNHADQLNPNNDAYWESRGWDGRPDDWEDRLDSGDAQLDMTTMR
jgi:hypothetical protein